MLKDLYIMSADMHSLHIIHLKFHLTSSELYAKSGTNFALILSFPKERLCFFLCK